MSYRVMVKKRRGLFWWTTTPPGTRPREWHGPSLTSKDAWSEARESIHHYGILHFHGEDPPVLDKRPDLRRQAWVDWPELRD